MTHRFNKQLIRHFNIIRLIAAVLIGILFAIVLIAIVSDDPGDALRAFFLGPFRSLRRFGNVLELMIPLAFAGLSISVMFTANQFNMGSEGAFYAGGGMATLLALELADLPSVAVKTLAILGAALVGGLICGIAGFLKSRFGTSELVASLMLNYIFYYLFKYIMFSAYKDPRSGYLATWKLPDSAKLGTIVSGTRVHTGFIIMIVVIAICYLYMKRSRWGYELLLTGQNLTFARHSGIKVALVMLSSQFIGGLLAGAGGAIQILGMYERFNWAQLPGYGFDGVIVAILAHKNPVFVPLAAFFLAYLRIGSDVMSSSTDVTNELIAIIQSIIILFISATVFLDFIRQRLVLKEAKRHE